VRPPPGPLPGEVSLTPPRALAAPFWHPTAARKEPTGETRALTRRRSFHLDEMSFRRLVRRREGRLPSLQRRVGRGNAVFPSSDALSEKGTPSSRFPWSCRKQGKPSSLLLTPCQRRERRVPGLQGAIGRREDGLPSSDRPSETGKTVFPPSNDASEPPLCGPVLWTHRLAPG
jgi:hypothetical protein